ncbi:MAG: formate dehydrogenase accessory sulfurtransferase FdhD [Actinomycetaceae bacterium]|nr:formate dehydrogenase accessory sulfurtransferase FdhD [Actinomycetaceae bacterium]
MSRVTKKTTVVRVGGARPRAMRTDTLAVEEPLEVRVGGEPLITTMRTPGHDIELVHGFLFSEGIISRASDVIAARYCGGADSSAVTLSGPAKNFGSDALGEQVLAHTNTYNVLSVTLPQGSEVARLRRNFTANSSCGVCGTATIAQVMEKRKAPVTPLQVDPALVVRIPDLLRQSQKMFVQTGATHATGLFNQAGELLILREDVGRHNATDKVIGAALMQGVDLSDKILGFSSRASFEMIQKTMTAGVPAAVAISSATSLAVELARECDIFLAGFVRGNEFNVYSGRLTP